MLRAALLLLASAEGKRTPSAVNTTGTFVLDVSTLAQTIWGIGFEIQSDSIGSGNNGLPESNSSVPWELTPSERSRFASEMLGGFRYCRLALGLYFRGLANGNRSIVERWPGQAAALAQMANISGIEGFAVEYWSPAPAWKTSGRLIGGSLSDPFNETFQDVFSNAVVTDLQYLQGVGLSPVMWGLQNEPPYSTSYSCCIYSEPQYTATFAAAAPKVHAAFPEIIVHVCSNTGQGSNGGGSNSGEGIAANKSLVALTDGWTWHCVGCDSNSQLGGAIDHFLNNSQGVPVWNNEFEYLDSYTTPERCINTAQSIMNWFAFGGSPAWYWLHALKPTENSESPGYGLGFWRPYSDTNFTHFPDVPAGHWTYNPYNWNGVAGFARYLPWDSVRVPVKEDILRPDNRILAYLFNPAAALWLHGIHDRDHYTGPRAGRDAAARAAATHLGIVVSNRGVADAFSFYVALEGIAASGPAPVLQGHGYGPNMTDVALGSVTAVLDSWGHWAVNLTVPPLAVQFWVQS